MASKLTASFILKLEDQLSNGLVKLERIFERLNSVGQKLGLGKLANALQPLQALTREGNLLTRTMTNIVQAADRAGAALARMARRGAAGLRGAGDKIGVIGGAVSAYAIAKPIEAYAGFDNILRHIAITEGMSGAGAENEIARLTGFFNKEALGSGQSSGSIANAFGDLVKFGIPIAEIEKLIPIHSRAATAYNISPEILGQAVGALAGNLKIGPEQMEGTLSAMALASKHGLFSVEDFSHFLPMITAEFALRGATGRPAADTAFAALETVRKNVGESGQAATDLAELLKYTRTGIGAKSFAKMGIDIKGAMLNAEKNNINPLDELLFIVNKHVTGTPEQIAQKLGLVRNSEAAQALIALMQHSDYLQQMRKLLSGADPGMLGTDFITASRAPAVQLRIFSEEIEQANRRLGQGFEPMLEEANLGLSYFSGAVDYLDKNFGGLGDRLILVTGGFLGVITFLGALGLVAGPVAAGFGLLVSPLTIAAAALVVLGETIYEITGKKPLEPGTLGRGFGADQLHYALEFARNPMLAPPMHGGKTAEEMYHHDWENRAGYDPAFAHPQPDVPNTLWDLDSAAKSAAQSLRDFAEMGGRGDPRVSSDTRAATAFPPDRGQHLGRP